MSQRVQLFFNAFILISLSVLFFLFFKEGRHKVAYVDSAKLLGGYQAMIEARKDYQSKTAIWKANVDTLMGEVQNSIKKYEKESAGMTPKERSLSQELLRTKQRQLNDYQRAIQEKAQQEDQRLTDDVLKQVNAFNLNSDNLLL